MSTVKERVEGHPVVFFLGALLVGYIAGIATYGFLISATDRTTISKEKLDELKQSELVSKQCIDTIEDKELKLIEAIRIQKELPKKENIKLHKFNIETNSQEKKSGPLIDLTFEKFSEVYYDYEVHFTIKEELAKSMLGKNVQWTAQIASISAGVRDDGSLLAVVIDPSKPATSPTAIYFDSSQRTSVLPLKRGDVIEFECFVSGMFGSLSISFDYCKLIDTW